MHPVSAFVSLDLRFISIYKTRGVDEIGLKDLAVERPKFKCWLGHMLVTWPDSICSINPLERDSSKNLLHVE